MEKGKPVVSVIIPTKNSEATLKKCLLSLKKQTFPNISIIIVDDFSVDDTIKIAKKYGTNVLSYHAKRSKARNYGAKHAKGIHFLFIDSDMELMPKVVEECVTYCNNTGYDCMMIPEISVGEGFLADCKALEKLCYIGDDTIEAARFFKRSTFEKVDGYDSGLNAGEDWDLTQRIRIANLKIGRIDAYIRHLEGRLNMRTILNKKFEYGKTIHSYRKKHPSATKLQLNAFRGAYRKNWKRLVNDPVHALGMLFIKACELVSFTIADKWFTLRRRFQ